MSSDLQKELDLLPIVVKDKDNYTVSKQNFACFIGCKVSMVTAMYYFQRGYKYTLPGTHMKC